MMVSKNNIIDVSSISEDETQLVKNQLESLLASPQFKLAGQQKKFLQFIVLKTLEGNNRQLKQYTIAVEGLGFADNFDPDVNPVIRINAGRIRKKLDKYYADEGVNSLLRISLPKGRYTPRFIRYKRLEKAEPLKIKDYSLAPKLAVMCFTDKTQDKESNRLLIQITDTLANELNKFLFIRIVVSIPHSDKTDAINATSEIKKSFKADYMLACHIQQLPKGRHLLLCRMLEVNTREVIWSDTYCLQSDVPFHHQGQIIGSITAITADIQQGMLFQHWSRKLLEDEASIPHHYKALVYYRNYTDDLGLDTLKQGVKVCRDYLSKNPDDVISNVILADFCRRSYVYGFDLTEISLEIGKQCALNAIRVKPNSHEAHYAFGQVLFCLGEKERALSEFKITRDLCQYHAYLEFGVGFHLFFMGEKEEGRELVNKVLGLSSNYPTWFNIVPFCDFFLQEKYEVALSYALKIDIPILFSGFLARCMTYVKLGEMEKAQKELQQALKYTPNLMEIGEELLARFVGSTTMASKFWEGIIKTSKS